MITFPSGTILLLYGSTIPSGWAKCDGTNGTPNLINKFVFGAKTDAELNTTGGSDTHAHVEPNTGISPAHNHGGSASATIEAQTSSVAAPTDPSMYKQSAPVDHGHGNATITIQSVDGHDHQILDTNSASSVPLHIQRIYIMKV